MQAGFSKNFKKQFGKLPKKIQDHFYRKLDIFIANPFHPVLNNHQLSGAMKNMKSIHIFDRAGAFAENKDVAREIRIKEIIPALDKNEQVILDFSKVDAATQSFIHALRSA